MLSAQLSQYETIDTNVVKKSDLGAFVVRNAIMNIMTRRWNE